LGKVFATREDAMPTDHADTIDAEAVLMFQRVYDDIVNPRLSSVPEEFWPSRIFANDPPRRRTYASLLSMVRETIELSHHDVRDPAEVARIDAACRAAGAYTLTELRFRFAKKLRQVIARGVIKTESEYDSVKDAVDSGMLGLEEMNKLVAMMAVFETRAVETAQAAVARANKIAGAKKKPAKP
jgi:hypothetical protein